MKVKLNRLVTCIILFSMGYFLSCEKDESTSSQGLVVPSSTSSNQLKKMVDISPMGLNLNHSIITELSYRNDTVDKITLTDTIAPNSIIDSIITNYQWREISSNRFIAQSFYNCRRNTWNDSVFYTISNGLLTSFEHYEEGGDQIRTNHYKTDFIYNSKNELIKRIQNPARESVELIISIDGSGNIKRVEYPSVGSTKNYFEYEFDDKKNPLKGLIGLMNFPPDGGSNWAYSLINFHGTHTYFNKNNITRVSHYVDGVKINVVDYKYTYVGGMPTKIKEVGSTAQRTFEYK